MHEQFPEFYRRVDEQPDAIFYEQARLVKHIDDGACQAAYDLYDELLPTDGHVLDLMSSYHSHLPNKFASVTGLGLNEVELEQNPILSNHVIHDLNIKPCLPFQTAQFDGGVCTVSVQYMTQPFVTFAEVARSLRSSAPFIVTFSNRMFPTKAVLAWRSSDDCAHARLVKSYFESTAAFSDIQTRCFVPEQGDPLFAVWALKK